MGDKSVLRIKPGSKKLLSQSGGRQGGSGRKVRGKRQGEEGGKGNQRGLVLGKELGGKIGKEKDGRVGMSIPH